MLISLGDLALAQEQTLSLSEFFQQRLAASSNTPPPSFEALLRVTDGVAASSPDDIATALPYLSVALKRDGSDLIWPGHGLHFGRRTRVAIFLEYYGSGVAEAERN